MGSVDPYANINNMPTDTTNIWNWPFVTFDQYLNAPWAPYLWAIVFVFLIIWFIQWRFNIGRPAVPHGVL